MPFLFLLLGIAIGWYLHAQITQGKRVSEIKKLREELAMTTGKTSKIQNQVSRMNQKQGLTALKRGTSR